MNGFSQSGGGKVLQSVQSAGAAQVDHTATYAAISGSVTITPKSANSKILISVNTLIYATAGAAWNVRLMRDTTQVAEWGDGAGTYAGYNDAGTNRNRHGFIFEDAAASAGVSHTYTLEVKELAGTVSSNSGGGGRGNDFLAMEVL